MKEKGTYLLVSRWANDSSNTDVATLTIEDPETEGCFEEFLANPEARGREFLLQRLKDIFALQHGGYGSWRMVRLYRVRMPSELFSLPAQFGETTIAMTLTPVFDFDEEGNPVPHQPRDHWGRVAPSTPCEAEGSA